MLTHDSVWNHSVLLFSGIISLSLFVIMLYFVTVKQFNFFNMFWCLFLFILVFFKKVYVYCFIYLTGINIISRCFVFNYDAVVFRLLLKYIHVNQQLFEVVGFCVERNNPSSDI